MFGFNWEPLNAHDEKRVLEAIAVAEKATSGEIRVHLDKWCKTDPVFKAKNLFTHLKMEQTEARNGVLIYVAVNEHKFAIVGDEGIDKKVGIHFWESTKDIMKAHFSKKELAKGLIYGIAEVGEQLKEYFPYQRGEDKNELPDEISYG